MKGLFLLCVFAWVFWRGPAPARNAWPDAVPAFAGEAACAFTFRDGGAFASVLSPHEPGAALVQAAEAFRAAGWHETAVRFADTRLFLKGGSVAAVLAQADPAAGTRLTVLVRKQ